MTIPGHAAQERETSPRFTAVDRIGAGRAGAPRHELPTLAFERHRFHLVARPSTAGAPGLLPEYKGSMLRGAFGHALRQAVCAMGPEQECRSCSLRAVCAYTRLFETYIEDRPEGRPPFSRGLDMAPRPFVLEVEETRRAFESGSGFAFDLVLVGAGIGLAPFARLAVERMAKRGLGTAKLPFAVDSVEASRGDTATAPRAGAAGSPVESAGPSKAGVTLAFLTPTRLKSKGHLLAEPTPRQLVFHMLRRVLEMAEFHGAASGPIDWDFRAVLDHAQQAVRVARADLAWRDWKRHSNRQNTDMLLGGFVGEMRLEGEIEPLLPLFRAIEVLHLGKGTTFGLGWVRVGDGRSGGPEVGWQGPSNGDWVGAT